MPGPPPKIFEAKLDAKVSQGILKLLPLNITAAVHVGLCEPDAGTQQAAVID